MTHTPNRRVRIAEEIRRLMAAQSKKPAELAAAAGISPAQIKGRLKGRKPFDTEELDSIAKIFHLRASDISRRTDVTA